MERLKLLTLRGVEATLRRLVGAYAMSRTLTDILVERERLVARCAQQRIVFASASRGLARPAATVDQALMAGRWLLRHPVAVAVVAVSLVVLRGRSVLGLAARGLAVWRLLSRVLALARMLRG